MIESSISVLSTRDEAGDRVTSVIQMLLLCAILLVMFIVYRMRKKDEGSYILDEPTRTHNGNLYSKTPNKEFYA